MTPLEFFIAVHNSEASDALDDVHAKVSGLQEQVGELYEGPAREIKIRTEIRAMIMEISAGQSPISAFSSTLERLSEVFKFALPGAVAVAATAAIVEAEEKAKDGAVRWLEAYRDVMSVDIGGASVEALQKVEKQAQTVIDQYEHMPWLERIVFGFAGVNTQALVDKARTQLAAVKDEMDSQAAASTRAKTGMMSDNPEIKSAAEITNIKLEYEEKIKAAREKNEIENADALEEQMSAAIDAVMLKDRQRHDAQMAQLDELKRAQAEAMDDPGDRMAALKRQQAALQQRIAADPEGFADPTGQRVKDETELARLQKEINSEQSEQDRKTEQAAKEASDAQTKAEEKTAELRKAATSAQFDALSKEDQVIVLRAAQAALEKNIKEAQRFGLTDDMLKFQKELADVQKKIADDTRRSNPWEHIDAYDALRGNMASGSFNRVTNDSANRAEKQRDDMVGYLKTLASRGNMHDLESF